ncbi:MAG: ExbD/TolR family protein [Allosphingosinicella sp.]
MRRIAVRGTFANIGDAPIATLNTTPLIDVMLVLLIMFIVTVPLATHSVKINLPVGTPPASADQPARHRLALDAAGRLSWDGAALAEAALPEKLDGLMATHSDDGVLELQAEAGTRYEAFDRVLATVKKHGVERLGFVGNERFVHAVDE